MDCCCKPQHPHQQHQTPNIHSSIKIPKLKYSFRTQQATPGTKYTNQTSTFYQTTAFNTLKQQKYGMNSTVASNNELIELQRQRQFLLQQDRNLNLFYEQTIIPLQKQVQFYQQQVKIRSIEIMELQDLLNTRLQERNVAPQPIYTQLEPMRQFVPQQPLNQFIPQPQPYIAQNQYHFNPHASNVVPVTVRPRQLIQN